MFVSNVLYCIISSSKSWDRKKDQQLLINWSVMFSFQISFLFSWLKRENYTEVNPENSERGGQDSCPLTSYIDTCDFSENSTNNKFQIKRGGHSPLSPQLNPPLLTDITSGVTFTHPSNQFEDYLRINPNLVGHKWKDKKNQKYYNFPCTRPWEQSH